MTATREDRPVLKRRRYPPEFKASIIAACQKPNVSIAQIARQHDLNANLVQNWIAQSRNKGQAPDTPGFVPLRLPAAKSERQLHQDSVIRIHIPSANGAVVVEWPSDQATQCLGFLRGLL